MSEVGSIIQILFIRTNHKVQETNVDLCGHKGTKLKALKVELLFSYKKKFRLKKFEYRFLLGTILQEHKSKFSSYIIYNYFYPGMFGIDSVSCSLLEKLI